MLAACASGPAAYGAGGGADSGAFLRIVRGQDVQRALDTAVRQIDGNLAGNRYYQSPGP